MQFILKHKTFLDYTLSSQATSCYIMKSSTYSARVSTTVKNVCMPSFLEVHHIPQLYPVNPVKFWNLQALK
jgi:hypothetical protein